jgi:hypothetical protein
VLKTPDVAPEPKGKVSLHASAGRLAQLSLHASAGRLARLLKERERLLRDIKKKQTELESTSERARAEAEAAAAQMAPLMQRFQTLSQQLQALFAELLADRSLSERARRQLKKVRRALELQGLLEEPEVPTERDAAWSEAAGAWSDGGRRAPPRDEPRPASRVASAPQHGQLRETLRGLFRSLARTLHPDRAREEPERERRTAAMKEVTRAYEDGDLARLLELEKAWRELQAPSVPSDPEARVSQLEQLNRELKAQAKLLASELRELKRSGFEQALGQPLALALAEAEAELDELAGVCDLVRKFRDKQSTLAELVRSLARGGLAVDGDELGASLLDALLSGRVSIEPPAQRPRRGRKRGGRKPGAS